MSASPTHSVEMHSPTSEPVQLSLPPPPPSSAPASGEVAPPKSDIVKVKPAALATEQDAASTSGSSSGGSRLADCIDVHVAIHWNLSIVDTLGTAENVLINEVSTDVPYILYMALIFGCWPLPSNQSLIARYKMGVCDLKVKRLWVNKIRRIKLRIN